MTNGVFAMPKVKVQTILTRNHARCEPRALCKSARELPHFSNTTMSEGKEATIVEDKSEDDDTEKLISQFLSKPRKLVRLGS